MNTVLIVEDDTPIRGMMQRWLQASGYAARGVGSAEEALDAMAAEPASSAVCDVGLPGKDGIWLTHELHRRYPDTAVVLATGATEMPGTASLATGVAAHLVKPIGQRQLREAVREAVEWREINRQTRQWTGTLEREMGERRARLHEAIARLDLSCDDRVGDAFAELIAGADARRHAHAVAALADRLATALHLDDTSRLDLERAALFHDLGKQAIPPALLDKPAPLTRDEREIVRRLPVEGYEALKDLAPLAGAANLILAMLERSSGLGYPRGLAGRAIPPGASILAVADALDTMTNPRPYRAAVSLAEALAELRRGRGSQFDPDVVDAALSLFAAS